MTVLAKSELIRKLNDESDFCITPILDESQIGPASIDFRLHKEFIIFKKSQKSLISFDIGKNSNWSTEIHKFQERVRLSFGEKFILHPGELILGGSLEYLSLPDDIFATVEGKSTLGRLGLIIATATSVNPGFKGCITLEIINEGEVPLEVKPGQRIGQFVFFNTSGNGQYSGKYKYPIGPQYAALSSTKER